MSSRGFVTQLRRGFRRLRGGGEECSRDRWLKKHHVLLWSFNSDVQTKVTKLRYIYSLEDWGCEALLHVKRFPTSQFFFASSVRPDPGSADRIMTQRAVCVFVWTEPQ